MNQTNHQHHVTSKKTNRLNFKAYLTNIFRFLNDNESH